MRAVEGQGRLLRKYVLVFGMLVSGIVLAGSAVQMFNAYQETEVRIFEMQRVEAARAALLISAFVDKMTEDVESVVPPPALAELAPDERELAFQWLKTRADEVADVAFIDADGNEQLFVSRLERDRRGSGRDRSYEDAFARARRQGVSYGLVTFKDDYEPMFQIGMSDGRPGGGVTVASVDLRVALDRVSKIHFGARGYAYVIDKQGRLIAHPDDRQVLKELTLTGYEQVRVAMARSEPTAMLTKGFSGDDVITAYEPIASTGWTVLVEQPSDEAFAPLWALFWRTIGIVLLGLALSLVAAVALTRRMIAPIEALRAGAARIREGALDQRIEIDTNDELEDVAAEFNRMAARLGESYATLEQKVNDRTRELAAARDELAVVSRRKSEFLANMSHELRAPLNAIIGFSKLLLEAPELTETQRQYVQDILDSGTHQLAVINDVLDLSKVEAGKLVLEPSTVSVPDVVSGAVALVRAQAAQHHITLVEEIDGSVGEVRADERKVRQVLVNLLSNAVKFTPDAGRVVVRAKRDDGELEITVSDTGVGIAPEDLPRIFTEFEQTASARGHEGSGLGLALAKRLVELHGGSMSVESTVGKGSTFTFVLPAHLN